MRSWARTSLRIKNLIKNLIENLQFSPQPIYEFSVLYLGAVRKHAEFITFLGVINPLLPIAPMCQRNVYPTTISPIPIFARKIALVNVARCWQA